MPIWWQCRYQRCDNRFCHQVVEGFLVEKSKSIGSSLNLTAEAFGCECKALWVQHSVVVFCSREDSWIAGWRCHLASLPVTFMGGCQWCNQDLGSSHGAWSSSEPLLSHTISWLFLSTIFFQNQQIYLSTASYGRSLLSTLMPYDKFTGTYENWKVCGRQKLTGSALKQDLSLFVGCNWWQLLKVLSKLTRIMIENCHTLRRIDLSRTLSFLVVNIWSLFAVAGHIINVLGEYSVENRVIWLRRTWCCSSGGWLSVLYASFGPSFAVSSFTLWCTTTFVKVLVLVLIWIKCMYWFVRRSNLSAHRMACFLLIKVCSRSKQRQERKYLPCRVARSSSGRLVHRVPPACRDSIRRNPNVVLLVFVLVCGAVNDIFNNVSDYFPRDCLDDKNSNITERKFKHLLKRRWKELRVEKDGESRETKGAMTGQGLQLSN